MQGKWLICSILSVMAATVAITACDSGYNRPIALDIDRAAAVATADTTIQGTQSTAATVHLSLALIDPDLAMDRLRQCVDGGIIRADGGWPVASNRMLWALAAWEVYLVNGDAAWLREAYQTIHNSLTAELYVRLDHRLGLALGHAVPPPGIDPTSDCRRLFEYADLGVNVTMAEACALMVRMSRELQRNGRSSPDILPSNYFEYADTLRRSINNHLWNPQEGMYAGALYRGIVYPLQSPLIDPAAEALAAITGVANPSMTRSIVEHFPTHSLGDTVSTGRAYWAWCANMARNPAGVDAAIGPDPLAFDSIRPAPPLAIRAAQYLRGMIGINLSPDGMTVTPVVPRRISGDKHVDSLQYRDCRVNITVVGTGSRIDHWKLNGVTHQGTPSIPANAKGVQNLRIVLDKDHARRSTTNDSPHNPPPAPVVEWTSPLNATIVDSDPRPTPPHLMLNGVDAGPIYDGHIALDPPRQYTEAAVTAYDDKTLGYATQPHIVMPDGCGTESEAPITDSFPAIFVTDSIAAGHYIVSVEGICPPGTPPAVCFLLVNHRIAGSIILSPVTDNTPHLVASATSNRRVVKLNSGNNRLEIITYHNPVIPHNQPQAYRLTRLDITPLTAQ